MANISLQGVSKSYVTGDSVAHALQDVSLQFEGSQMIAVVGPSGCGKSTLLNVIGLLTTFDKGQVTINGIDVVRSKLGRDSRKRSALFSYIVQDFALIESETTAGNVILPLVYGKKRIGPRRRRTVVRDALANVGLAGFEAKPVRTLSGGERQRVAIARALAGYADVVLADEPTGALDSANSLVVFEMLRSLATAGKTVIMATHNRELAALCDRVVEMKDGALVADSSRR
jgi:ABC-type lipoprotein export system ATPase subunit